MEIHGIHGNPWKSIEIHGIHGNPWNPWKSMESMEIHGIRGNPCPPHEEFHTLRIYPKSIENLLKIYRKSIENLSKIYRTSIEHLSNIYRKPIEHLSNIYRTSIENLSTPSSGPVTCDTFGPDYSSSSLACGCKSCKMRTTILVKTPHHRGCVGIMCHTFSKKPSSSSEISINSFE